MPLYVITTFPDREGVTLSKSGHWGGMPFPDVDAAHKAAVEDARFAPGIEVKTEVVKRKRA